MRTAIVSELHLGNSYGEDVVRDPGMRRLLLEEIGDADRVVLLGDAIELRDHPLPRAFESARPFFEELGAALAGREVVLAPGNHDHRLAEPLLEEVAGRGGRPGLAEVAAAPDPQISRWLGDARLTVAYPGIWIREDVYATHGHYMDCHLSLPRLESLAAASLIRLFGRLPERLEPADYERVLRPIYAASFALAQGGLASRARPSENAWKLLTGGRGEGGRARRAAIRAAVAAGVPAGVWTANRLLRTRFEPDITAAAITRSGIEGTVETARRLGLEPAHLITGHTHRGGPNPNDPRWRLTGGGGLHNTGSWVFATAFHHPGTPPGPYWPGTVTWVEDEGPPRRVSLLRDVPGDELRAIVARQRAAG
jgi:hypothetical protein